MRKMKSGFTLAEVLITLGIIGVIAAIVMPSVMTNYTYKTLGVKLSKFAALLEGSTRPYVVQNTSFTNTPDIISSYITESFIVKNNAALKEQTVDCSKSGEERPAACPENEKSEAYTYNPVVMAKAPTFTGNRDLKNLTLAATETIIQLKDGTEFVVYPLDTTYDEGDDINTFQVGEAVFGIAFAPNVNGLPASIQKSYQFIVTELGYAFPDRENDDCSALIYDANFETNSKTFGKDSVCITETTTTKKD